jgi:citrate lyase subunit beta/citryl-CoA lyase
MRSWLFVPGSRADRFDKAAAAGADMLIIDLEDAVAPEEKAAARAAIRDWLTAERKAVIRINAAGTDWFSADLALAALPGVVAVMLPKAERIEDLVTVMQAGAAGVVPLIETAAGLAAAQPLAAADGVLCLAFGSLDFQVDLGLRDATEDDLIYFRSQLVLASRLAGLAGPIDGVTTAIDDTGRLRIDVTRAWRLGFGGKLCIHPRQIAEVHNGFTPDAATVAWAQRVIAAADGGGVATVDGEMVDKPVLLRAQTILREAHRRPVTT